MTFLFTHAPSLSSNIQDVLHQHRWLVFGQYLKFGTYVVITNSFANGQCSTLPVVTYVGSFIIPFKMLLFAAMLLLVFEIRQITKRLTAVCVMILASWQIIKEQTQ